MTCRACGQEERQDRKTVLHMVHPEAVLLRSEPGAPSRPPRPSRCLDEPEPYRTAHWAGYFVPFSMAASRTTMWC